MTQENIPLQLNEEIKPIQGYEDLYSITSFGRVWSHKRRVRKWNGYRRCGGRFLNWILDKDGYPYVGLNEENKKEKYIISRLTAIYYIPNPLNLPEVNHKDGNKLNNFAGTAKDNYVDGNLEWCDYDHNLKHAMENGLRPKRSSKFYGVSFHKGKSHKIRPWQVNIMDGGKQIYLGSYKTEIEAAQAYNKYVIEHNLNRLLNDI